MQLLIFTFTGLFSRELAPYTKSIVGIDISPKSVEYYNQRANEQGISPDEMKAVCIELKGEEGELDGAKFDVVTVSLSCLFMFYTYLN